jgi:two-component system alkaline phosphatase synthesis response regulator PhoP
MYKILVVEDDRNLADTLSCYFGNRLYQIISKSDGDEGFKAARSKCFDLILLDVMLPGRSGFLVAKNLRQAGVNTPIMMISGKNSCEDILTGFQCGVDGYLCKPFNLRELKARCDALLKRIPVEQATKISVANIVLHPDRFQFTRQGNPVPLRRKEFLILKYLFEHKDKAISRTQMINELWTDEEDTQMSTLDVHISNIRRKLNAGYTKKVNVIETIHEYKCIFTPSYGGINHL